MEYQQVADISQSARRWETEPHLSHVSARDAIHPILRLQNAIGNRGVQRLIQAKLATRPSDDIYEPEADRVAKQVAGSSSEPAVQRKCACGGTAGPNGECEECREKRVSLRRKNRDSDFGGSSDSSVPPIVHEVLRSPGQPLEAATRAFMEPRFGHDFSEVRIHSDARAAESARSVNALAYTVGRQVVFGPSQYRPGTESGDNLLAHELAHTVQQAPGTDRASGPLEVTDPADATERAADRSADAAMRGSGPVDVGRSPGGGTSVARLLPEEPVPVNDHADGAAKAPAALSAPPQQGPTAPAAKGPGTQAAKPEDIVRQWLDKHQFAPPQNQPDDPKAERHLLLNGEDMTVSDAVKLAVADTMLSQPPELIKSVMTAALAEPDAGSVRTLPFIGPGNKVIGINLDHPRDGFGISPGVGQTVDFSTIDGFLDAHHFAAPEIRDPNGDRVLFDGKETTVEDVADRAFAILGQYPSLKKHDVVVYIRQKYVGSRGGASNQIVLGYTLIPKSAQLVGGPLDPNNPLRTQHQFSFTITRQHHANDSPGLESSFQGSVTFTDQGILNVQAGGQEAIVKPLLEGWVQVSGLVQLMASANWSKSVSGSTVISPAVQAAAGGQILVTPTFRSGDFKFLNGHVQFGLQVLGGGQASSHGVVGTLNAGLVLNIPFSL